MDRKYLIFNENGNDVERDLLIDLDNPSTTTGIYNLEKIKFVFAENFYTKQQEFLWIPEEIRLINDKNEFENLSDEHKSIFENVLSFLIFLDSIQDNNLTILKTTTNDYSIKRALGLHAYVEGGIHAYSYQYILDVLYGKNSSKKEEVYYRFKTNPLLKERNKIISAEYQKLVDIVYNGLLNTDKDKFYNAVFRNLITDYLLEGVIFYMGFMVFHIFAYELNSLKMVNQIIQLIKRDENLHTIRLFMPMIKYFKDRYGKYYSDDFVYDLTDKTVNADIEFYTSIINNNLPSISDDMIKLYIKYLANERLKSLGLKPIYGDIKNPFEYIEKVTSKASFFESGNVEYKHSTSDKSVLYDINLDFY